MQAVCIISRELCVHTNDDRHEKERKTPEGHQALPSPLLRNAGREKNDLEPEKPRIITSANATQIVRCSANCA
jgi:hypothetical protein